ncbi:isopeptide-forming domain-containing fimbrial protein, partial [Brochothrix campestris]
NKKLRKNVFNASNDAIDHKAVKVGAVISYQIKATNTSAPTTIINKVKIGDAIPAGLVYQRGSLKVTGVDGKEKALTDDVVTGQKLATGDLGSLKGGESLFISFKVKVSAEAKGKVVNVATVDGNVPPPTPGEPDVPLVPEKPTTDINVPEIEVPNTPPNKPNITVPEKPSVSKKITILPKTGDKAENNELGIGMILLVLTTLIIVRRKEVFNK